MTTQELRSIVFSTIARVRQTLSSRNHASRRLRLQVHLGLFVFAALAAVLFPLSGFVFADEVQPAAAIVQNSSAGWAYIAAALATGIGSIGAGIAVAAAAPAAIGALAEDGSTFGKAMIFVGLGEGLAIFGLLVSILILQKV